MEPRPYQAEAFDAARKANVVMVGATGVGKTLVSLMLIRDFYFEDARRREVKNHKWCVFLCPTQELVFQQARSAQVFTGVRCSAYVGRDLDYWGLSKWKEEMDSQDVLVMTPNALLNLLHRGKEYLSLANVGVLVFDECHKARKKHPYARVMAFYLELMKQGGDLPKVFGMTASPTVECVQVLQSKAYVCEDDLIDEYQANAQWELLFYKVFSPSQTVVEELEALLRMLFSDSMCGFGDSKEKFVNTVVTPVLFSYQHLGLWCAIRHIVMFCEGFLRSRVAQNLPDRSRVARTKKVVFQLAHKLLDSPLGLEASGIKSPVGMAPSVKATDRVGGSLKGVADGAVPQEIASSSSPTPSCPAPSGSGPVAMANGGSVAGGDDNCGGGGDADADADAAGGGDDGGGGSGGGNSNGRENIGASGERDFESRWGRRRRVTETSSESAISESDDGSDVSDAPAARMTGRGERHAIGEGVSSLGHPTGVSLSPGGVGASSGRGRQRKGRGTGFSPSGVGRERDAPGDAMEEDEEEDKEEDEEMSMQEEVVESDEMEEDHEEGSVSSAEEGRLRRRNGRKSSRTAAGGEHGSDDDDDACGSSDDASCAEDEGLHANTSVTAEAEAAEWGMTPGRITTLVKTLLRVSEEWGEEALHFRCMVFVERRATARILSEYLSHALAGRFASGFVVGRAKARGSNVHGSGAVNGPAAHHRQSKEWRPLPDDIAREGSESEDDKGELGEETPAPAAGALLSESPASGAVKARSRGTEPIVEPIVEKGGEGEASAVSASSTTNQTGVSKGGRTVSQEEALCEDVQEEEAFYGIGGFMEQQRRIRAAAAAAAAIAQVAAAGTAKSGQAVRGHEEGEAAAMQEGESADDVGTGEGFSEGGAYFRDGRMTDAIDLFRAGKLQILVTTDACSEGIDVPECNLVVSMDQIKTSRTLIHTRGRARSKGGKFVIMVEDQDNVYRDRVSLMLMESEDIKRYQLAHEKASGRVPLRHSHPKMVHKIDSTAAVIDMDMSTPLMHSALAAMGCDFHPLFIAEEKKSLTGVCRQKSYKCRLELPSFLGMSTIDTETLVNEHFWTKSQARAAVSFLAVLQMLEKGYIDHRLNPRRTKDRLVVETRRGYDPVLVEGRAARVKAKMPVPRPVAMGILPTPGVNFDLALMMAWKADDTRSSSREEARGLQLGEQPRTPLAAPGVDGANSVIDDEVEQMNEERGDEGSAGTCGPPSVLSPAGTGLGSALWEGARTRGCYENVPGPKQRMRVYCFRSPPGEVDGWVPSKRVRKKKTGEGGEHDEEKSEEKSKSAEPREGGEEGEGKNDGGRQQQQEHPDEDEDDEEDDEEHEPDMRSFHPRLQVDLGRGPGKGLGPRLFVGLASAAPLPLTASQASKLGISDSFDVDLNPAEMAAIVQWHRETVGMAALYDIPPQMTNTPRNDPAKSPFLETGSVGDKGVLAVPVEYGDDEPDGDGVLKIDWASIEAANAGVHPPNKTDEDYTRRILFSRVSHKTSRFYFVLEKTTTTLGEYLTRCLESDLGPYAGLPCETITAHAAGRYGRVRGVLAVGHGVRTPDYQAAYKSQRLLLGVPAPALRHSFAQHLIRGEKVMDPDAGVRGRIKAKRPSSTTLEKEKTADHDASATAGFTKGTDGGGDDSKDPEEVGERQAADKKDDVVAAEEDNDRDNAEIAPMDDSDPGEEGGGGDAMSVDPPVHPPASKNSTAGESAISAAATLEQHEGEEEEGELRGWAGVSTLKLNNHKVGPGQPVLLVEQYTQSICCTRRVFISVLHLVPRMFDLERQLLCFVLHEALFLPALQTSLYHRQPPANGVDDKKNGKTSVLGQAADEGEGASLKKATGRKEMIVSDATAGALAPSHESQLSPTMPVASGAPSSSAAAIAALADEDASSTLKTAVTAVAPSDSRTAEKEVDREEGNHDMNVDEEHGSGSGDDRKGDVAAGGEVVETVSCAAEENTVVSWPSCGTWCTPGEGAGTGSGPGGSGYSNDSINASPLNTNVPGVVLGTGIGRTAVGAAAEGGAQAAARAAAMGVIQWQGSGEGAVADTMALLDCSLRRPVNERLETLGDAWLNYYAGFVVFQDKPVMMEEGMMTLLRKNVVSNARLLKCADGRGLREFVYPPRSILGRPFEMWAPSLLPLPPPVKASRKTIADAVEALLGAALVAGGNRSGAYLMEWLGLPTLESSNDPARAKAFAENPAAATAAPASERSDGDHGQAHSEVATAAKGGTARSSPGLDKEDTGRGETAPENGRHGGGSDIEKARGQSNHVSRGTSTTEAEEAGTPSPPPMIGEGALNAATAAAKVADLLEKDGGYCPEGVRAREGELVVTALDSPGGSTLGSAASNGSSSASNTKIFSEGIVDESSSTSLGDGDGECSSASLRTCSNLEGAGPSPKRKSSTSEDDYDLAPASKRIRTPEGQDCSSANGEPSQGNGVEVTGPGAGAGATGATPAGTEGGRRDNVMDVEDDGAVAAATISEERKGKEGNAGMGGEGKESKDRGDEEKEEGEREGGDTDNEGPDSGDEGGGAVTDAAAAKAAARAAATAALGDPSSEHGNAGSPAGAKSADVGRDGGGKARCLRDRAPLPDHIPAVDDRKRPWLWNPPAYLWGDPERFGGWSRDTGEDEGRPINSRPSAGGGEQRHVPGVHPRKEAAPVPSSPPVDVRGVRSGSGRGGTEKAVSEVAKLSSMATKCNSGSASPSKGAIGAGMETVGGGGRDKERAVASSGAKEIDSSPANGDAVEMDADVDATGSICSKEDHDRGDDTTRTVKSSREEILEDKEEEEEECGVGKPLSKGGVRRDSKTGKEVGGEATPDQTAAGKGANRGEVLGGRNQAERGNEQGPEDNGAGQATAEDEEVGRKPQEEKGVEESKAGDVVREEMVVDTGVEGKTDAGLKEQGDEEVTTTKATKSSTAQKWAGLCLEGLKGSATWPIQREPLMSTEFLAETGVLPKVYVTTRPSARLMGNIRRLENKLGYTFRYPWLCMQAITHPSWTMFDRNWKHAGKNKATKVGIDRHPERIGPGGVGAAGGGGVDDYPPGTVPAQDYQRLEFLGDAVLGWMVTAHLYFASSSFTPAELTRIKSSCVCNASLWVIALRLDVHHVFRASPKILGHVQAFIENNGNDVAVGTPPKHPADVLEALIAAVFLDSSCCMNTVSRVFWPKIAQYLQDYPPPAEDELDGKTTAARAAPVSISPAGASAVGASAAAIATTRESPAATPAPVAAVAAPSSPSPEGTPKSSAVGRGGGGSDSDSTGAGDAGTIGVDGVSGMDEHGKGGGDSGSDGSGHSGHDTGELGRGSGDGVENLRETCEVSEARDVGVASDVGSCNEDGSGSMDEDGGDYAGDAKDAGGGGGHDLDGRRQGDGGGDGDGDGDDGEYLCDVCEASEARRMGAADDMGGDDNGGGGVDVAPMAVDEGC